MVPKVNSPRNDFFSAIPKWTGCFPLTALVIAVVGLVSVIFSIISDLFRRSQKVEQEELLDFTAWDNFPLGSRKIPQYEPWTRQKISPHDLEVSKKSLGKELQVSEEIREAIKKALPDIIRGESNDGYELYPAHHSHSVFSLKAFPRFVFKLDKHVRSKSSSSMPGRYENMLHAEAVIRSNRLDSLVIPRAILFDLPYGEDGTLSIIMEEKLPLLGGSGDAYLQKELYKQREKSLNTLARQLAVFICKTGYADTALRNLPLLDRGGDLDKVGLIDLESMEEPRCGLENLIGCFFPEQAEIIRNTALQYNVPIPIFDEVLKKRKEQLEKDKQLADFYRKNKITTGKEPLALPLNKSAFSDYEGRNFSPVPGFSPLPFDKSRLSDSKDEEPSSTDNGERSDSSSFYTRENLEDLASYLVKYINEKIAESSSSTPEGKRRVFIDVSDPEQVFFHHVKHEYTPPEEAEKPKSGEATEEELFYRTPLGCVIDVLKQSGQIQGADMRLPRGVVIQA